MIAPCYKTLKENLDGILSKPFGIVFKSELEDLKYLAQTTSEKSYEEKLELNVMLAKAYEEFLKKEYLDDGFFEIAKANDFSGRYSSLIAHSLTDSEWKEIFYRYALQFKVTAGKFYIKNALLKKSPRRKKQGFYFAGVCYDRAAFVAFRYLKDIRDSIRLKKRAAYFYEKTEAYDEVIWRLSRTIQDMFLLGNVSKTTIEKLYLRIKKNAKLNESKGKKPYPDNFELMRLTRLVQSALR